jgi:hypothetical protein
MFSIKVENVNHRYPNGILKEGKGEAFVWNKQSFWVVNFMATLQ